MLASLWLVLKVESTKVVLMPSAYGVVGGCKNGVKAIKLDDTEHWLVGIWLWSLKMCKMLFYPFYPVCVCF